jgi:enhancing lycopene biosynthesis protein 2
VAVLLSGCGVYDGSEIHEAVAVLLALDRAGAEAICCAPDVEQAQVVDHATGRVAAGERRNVLVESARIARGKIRAASAVGAGDADALILPGGFGAAKNLSDFAARGARAEGQPDAVRLIREFHAARKPVGLCCIAPAVGAIALRGSGVHAELTIGDDAGVAAALEAMGARHVEVGVREAHVDRAQRIVSTPAYMCEAGIADVAAGVETLVGEVLALCS